MAEKTRKYYDELNIFRALIIIWVAIGHSTDYVAAYPFSGFFKYYAYTFHMYAFFLLSGLLFASKLKRIHGISDMGKTALNRIKRLYVPYLFFSVITYLIKFFFEKYTLHSLPDNPLLMVICINNANGGIWFLFALLLISLIAILLYKVPNWVMLIATFALHMAYFYKLISAKIYLPFNFFYQYAFFFYLGVFLFEYYDTISEKLNTLFNKKKILSCCVATGLLAASFIISYLKRELDISSHTIMFFIASYQIFVWYLASYVFGVIKPFKKLLMVIGDYGMDIYLIGYFIQNAIFLVLGKTIGAPFLFYTTLMFFLGVFLPIPISKYFVRPFKITRILVLGDFSNGEKTKQQS